MPTFVQDPESRSGPVASVAASLRAQPDAVASSEEVPKHASLAIGVIRRWDGVGALDMQAPFATDGA